MNGRRYADHVETWGTVATRTALAIALMLIIAACLRSLFEGDAPAGNRELISMIIGALLIRLTDVYAYHFNSTPSSQRKDATIATLASTANQAQAALAPVPGAPAIPVVEVKPDEQVTVKGTDP